jgi:hypothetical protein
MCSNHYMCSNHCHASVCGRFQPSVSREGGCGIAAGVAHAKARSSPRGRPSLLCGLRVLCGRMARRSLNPLKWPWDTIMKLPARFGGTSSASPSFKECFSESAASYNSALQIAVIIAGPTSARGPFKVPCVQAMGPRRRIHGGVLDCGGKRSATPLWLALRRPVSGKRVAEGSESAVDADALPAHSKASRAFARAETVRARSACDDRSLPKLPLRRTRGTAHRQRDRFIIASRGKARANGSFDPFTGRVGRA